MIGKRVTLHLATIKSLRSKRPDREVMLFKVNGLWAGPLSVIPIDEAAKWMRTDDWLYQVTVKQHGYINPKRVVSSKYLGKWATIKVPKHKQGSKR